MTSTLCALLLSSSMVGHREVLPNGLGIAVQPMEGLQRVSLTLVASSAGSPDTVETHGRRHLLEHLIAKGAGGRMDRLLEVHGMVLMAYTTRDAMVFEFLGPASATAFAIESAADLLRAPGFTAEQIQREMPIIEEEFVLEPTWLRQSAQAWRAAFENDALDPTGDLETIRRTTPEHLHELHRRQFSPPGVAVTLAGYVDLAQVVPTMRRVFGAFPRGEPRPSAPRRRVGTLPAQPLVYGEYGEVVAAYVGGLGARGTMGVLAAAFAVEATLPGVRVVYTPSSREGLVLLTSRHRGSLQPLFETAPEEWAGSFGAGRAMLRGWIRGINQNPSRWTLMQGLAITLRGFEIDTLERQWNALTMGEFLEGIRAFQPPRSVRVEGAR